MYNQVFRLLRSLRPLRVINRAPGLKLVVQTLLSSLRPIGNIVLICCTFFIIFGILGVQVTQYLLLTLTINAYIHILHLSCSRELSSTVKENILKESRTKRTAYRLKETFGLIESTILTTLARL